MMAEVFVDCGGCVGVSVSNEPESDGNGTGGSLPRQRGGEQLRGTSGVGTVERWQRHLARENI